MKSFMGLPRGWDSCLILLTVLSLVTSCAIDPQIVTRSASRETLDKLRADSADLASLAIQRSSAGADSNRPWNAPDTVEVPMEWSGGLPHVQALVNGHPVSLILDS